MPRVSTGSVYLSRDKWFAKVTLGPDKRPTFALPTCANEKAARKRLAVLADLAAKLRVASVALDVAERLLTKAAAADGKPLAAVLAAVDALCKGQTRAKSSGPIVTVRDLGERWTSGELARAHPDHVKAKRSVYQDVLRFRAYVYPIVGDEPIATFTLDHAEAVMQSLPGRLAPASRRQVASMMHRLLAMAVFPLRLLPANPLPRGFLPRAGAQKAKGWLYPDEDRRLLASPAVPLCWRLLYGFLDREGMRLSEAARLDVADVDLVRGAVSLNKNKTDEPRTWALSPGVANATGRWLALRGNPGPDAPLFLDEDGGTFVATIEAKRFRKHLRAAGVDRPELYEQTAERQQIRLHDLRATFITIALANGRSETWVADRTGHKSSMMINRYRRAARTAGELGLGDLAPLDVAIPELAPVGGEGDPEQGAGNGTERDREASAGALETSAGGSKGSHRSPRPPPIPGKNALSPRPAALVDPVVAGSNPVTHPKQESRKP
jgi:integrase